MGDEFLSGGTEPVVEGPWMTDLDKVPDSELAKWSARNFVPWACFHQQFHNFFHVTTCLAYIPSGYFSINKIPPESKGMAINSAQLVTLYSHMDLSVQACVTFLLWLSSGLKVAKVSYLSKDGVNCSFLALKAGKHQHFYDRRELKTLTRQQ